MKKFFSIFLALALVLAILPVAGAQAQKPVAYESSVQVRNLSANAGALTISFYNLSGFLVKTVEKTIGANETITMLRDSLEVDPGFNGSVVVASNVPTAGMSNLHGLMSGGTVGSYAAFNAFTAGTPKVYLPTLMKDNYGYDTFFYVQNLGAEKANVTINYSDGLVVEKKDINPGASVAINQKQEVHAGKVFAATVTGTQNIAVTVAQEGNTLMAYNGFGAGALKPIMPLVQENNYNFFSGVQIQNIGTEATTVTLSYTPSMAGDACYEKQTIPAGESRKFGETVFVIGEPGIETDCVKGSKFIGSAAVTGNSANQLLVAAVNQLNRVSKKGGSYNAFDPAQGGSGIIFPLIHDRNYGYWTSWSITNVGSAEIAAEGIVCTVTGKDKGGTPVTVTLKNSAAVAVGESWTLNHEGIIADGFVGGATCSAAGGKVLGTTNQYGSGSRYTGKDSLLVSEGFVIP